LTRTFYKIIDLIAIGTLLSIGDSIQRT